MPALTITYRDAAERLALEQATAYVCQLRQVAQDAPAGTVLAACEQLTLTEGRALLRSTLASALQGRIDSAEQKGGPPAPVHKRTPGARRATTPARS